jgi:2-oxoglutarate dehydrogenase E2 component (dihydrolipoamide succinyltransferase)
MIDVEMPQMGESIVEGTLTRWLKKPGDRVERDEPLFEISTDKVDTEIPSPVAGVLSEVLVQEGATVAIKTIVARIGDGAAKPKPAPVADARPATPPAPPPLPMPTAAAPLPPPVRSFPPPPPPPVPQPAAAGPYPVEPPEPPPPPAPPAETEEEYGLLSPLVRKMAREFNIDLSQVKGTGAGGRITKQDVETYMSTQAARTYAAPPVAPAARPLQQQPPPAPAPVAAQPAPVPVPTAPPPAAAAPPPAPASQPTPPAPIALSEAAKTRVEPMSNMRQKIAEHMVNSKHTSAHVTTVHKVDMTKIAKLRAKSKDEFHSRNGFSLTFLPFVTAAAAEALRSFPLFNASIDGKNIVYYREINIGIAVALEGGLIVPVIRNADEKNVAGLQRAIVDLAARARSRQLKPDEVQGGTFSITNFGSFGSIFATPVINQPQVAILGVGAVEKLPVVVDGDAIAIRSQAHLALTFDHRLIDGALADQFCQKVKGVLESWSADIL